MKKPSTKVISLIEWKDYAVYKWIQQQIKRGKSENKKL
jgi:hypothetical protein